MVKKSLKRSIDVFVFQKRDLIVPLKIKKITMMLYLFMVVLWTIATLYTLYDIYYSSYFLMVFNLISVCMGSDCLRRLPETKYKS